MLTALLRFFGYKSIDDMWAEHVAQQNLKRQARRCLARHEILINPNGKYIIKKWKLN